MRLYFETSTMNAQQINSIDKVISVLGIIIAESEQKNDPGGYFAVLYKKVTIKVKEGIASGYFDDGPRMEQLDVVFAKRYLDAYFSFQKGENTTHSWQKAFELSTRYRPIVLQHLVPASRSGEPFSLGLYLGTSVHFMDFVDNPSTG